MATIVPLEKVNVFASQFEALTGHAPFPWQERLYADWFSKGKFPPTCTLPTGLGKTSVVAVWLIALANYPAATPRRLIYVVNRRTVVDQTTNEVLKLRNNTQPAGLFEPLKALCGLCLKENESPLAISTLRGQFADNREWSADPGRPAAIVGTVDMIGSRLLFSGYGVGYKSKPLHAGFLGQDTLVVHDEAHLEPAFQALLDSIKAEQHRCKEFGAFHVMALTATSRSNEQSFVLTDDEKNPPHTIPDPPIEPLHVVWPRLKAKKAISFVPARHQDVARQIGLLAQQRKESGKAVLVFVRNLEDVMKVKEVLTEKKAGVPADTVQLLTGTLRGLERDRLLREDPIFARFLLNAPPDGTTVYLICTSAGEVGIDISADHMICDLVPLDSMIQRLGRVNRRGQQPAEVELVYESDPDEKQKDSELEKARWKTLEIIQSKLKDDASPLALANLKLNDEERKAALTPGPTILPATDILFDSWALTTIRDMLPGRPPVEPYLHGLSPWEPPDTYVGWRHEVGLVTGDLLDEYGPEDLLEDYPLKPHELLRDRSYRVIKDLTRLAERTPDSPAWLVADGGEVEVFTLGELIRKENRDRMFYRTVLLPPSIGGLDRNGFLNSDPDAPQPELLDVADEWLDAKENRRRRRLWDDKVPPEGMRLIRAIDMHPTAEDESETSGQRYWYWYELSKTADGDGSNTATKPVGLEDHTNDVARNATGIVAHLPLSADLKKAIIFAAECHDLGKARKLFQHVLGNAYGGMLLAKSGGKTSRIKTDYRHEFGSLLDIQDEPALKAISEDMKDLVLHLIAAHHGRGRPHFPPDEAFDPEPKGRDARAIASEVPRRFARMQRKYGRWGLTYLESLLRAADYAASANPTKFIEADQ